MLKRCSIQTMWSVAIAGYLVAIMSGCIALYLSQANSVGLSGADESAHFLNGVFVGTYLKNHLLVNPLAYAADYYLHYPKISIGHWPPAYYGFLGVLFLVVPPTPENAILINLFVSALPAVAVAAALACLSGIRTALLGALTYTLAPLVVEGFNFFMLDQVLAALAVAATAAWLAYVNRQTWPRAFLFAGLFVAAVLVKGNGWLVVFVPAWYLLLGRAWRVLAPPAIYVALLVAAGIVLPWYWFTSGIAADGFNYQPGLPFALLALNRNIATLSANLSWVAFLLAIVGVGMKYRTRHRDPLPWQIVCGCLSLILATLTLQSLVPADTVDRYMAPALPPLVVLALVGMEELYRWLRSRQHYQPWFSLAFVLLGVLMLLPGIRHLSARMQKVDFRMQAAASLLAEPSVARTYLIDGSAGAEGAFIAEMAVRDPGLKSYVVRSSKLFSESNFMGAGYRLKFTDLKEMLAKMHDIGIQYVVLVKNNHGRERVFPHSKQLAEALALPGSPYRRVRVLPHGGRDGITEVYQANDSISPNFAAVRQLGTPAKANIITHQVKQTTP